MDKRFLAAALAALMLPALAACDPMPDGVLDGGSVSTGSDAAGSDFAQSASAGAEESESAGASTSAFPDDGGAYEQGDESGFIGDVMHTYWFDFVVNDAYRCGEFGGYEAPEGRVLLVVDISIRNTCLFSVDMWDGDFPVFWDGSDPEYYSAAYPVSANPESADPDCQTLVDEWLSDSQLRDEYSIGINETLGGLLIYEVDDGVRDFFLEFAEYFEDGEAGDCYDISFTARDER